MRALYVDLDGTLLGRHGSLFHDGDGAVSPLGVQAVHACLRADVEVVLMSGRGRSSVAEAARLLGQRSYIFEAGSCLVLDGVEHWLTGEFAPGELSIFEQIEASGAPGLLLDRYGSRLDRHWQRHARREVAHVLCGLVDVREANELLAARGHGNLRLLDNGVGSHNPGLRSYQLVPAGVSKASAVAAHRTARGLERAATVGVGDSREDLRVASEVRTLWLAANAIERDTTMIAASAEYENVRIARGGFGGAVHEAVAATLESICDHRPELATPVGDAMISHHDMAPGRPA